MVPTSEIPFLCWRRKRTVQAIRRGFLRWRKRDSDFPFWKRKILLSPRTYSLPCTSKSISICFLPVIKTTEHSRKNNRSRKTDPKKMMNLTTPRRKKYRYEFVRIPKVISSRFPLNPIVRKPRMHNAETHLSRVDLLAGERVVVGTHLECWRCVTGRFVVWRIEVLIEKSRRGPLFRGGGYPFPDDINCGAR